MSREELNRYGVMQLVLAGQVSLADAARSLGVSYRHAKRLKEKAEQGAEDLAHGNRGRSPTNKTDEQTRALVLELSEEKYRSFNDTHFTEFLQAKEEVRLSRETVRTLRRQAGIKPKRKRRTKKHYSRRPRKVAEGLMVLWDGSPHRWFGKGSEGCCLMAAIDDATGKVLEMFFTPYEGSWAYLKLLEGIIGRHGIPVSIYQDRHSSLKRNDDFWSIEEQLMGKQYPTQVGAALEGLGIEAIFAQTPQAKGKVEKLFGTLQDRLVAELELAGITDQDSANAFIRDGFLEEFNARFEQGAEEPVKAWRKVSKGMDLKRILSFKYEATVGNDNAIRYAGMIIDIPPGPGGRGYAGAKVEVRQLLDGSWRVYYQDRVIAEHEATSVSEPILARRRKKGSRAATESAWVYLQSAPGDAQPERADSVAKTATGSARRAGPGRTIGATRIA